MPLGRELIGIPVRAAGLREPLGEVVDLCFDRRGRLRALAVLPRTGFFRKERPIPIQRFLQVNGEGAVLASRDDMARAEDGCERLVRLRTGERALRGLLLFGPDGRELGWLGDVALEPGTLEIWGFEVSGGALMDLLDGRSIVGAQGARAVEGGLALTDLPHMNLEPEGEANP
ncbi:MAG: hypothetical protein CW345_02480 [Firmicutes bacterium]|nr:hypothetical protein [Bacillota bacterium]